MNHTDYAEVYSQSAESEMYDTLNIVQRGDGLCIWGRETIATEVECTMCGWRRPVSVGNQTHRALEIVLAHIRLAHAA